MLFVIIALCVFAVDRLTKSLVNANVPFGTEFPVVDHLVGITNLHNSGAAFGFAPAGAALYLIAAVVVSIGLAIYVARHPGDLRTDAILGLIMGGTIGNGFDRIAFGTVTDFINFHFWPVFNVADSAISIGVVALLAGYVLRKPDAA
ncbi:MAG TPA: signal peptidase II [Candidatus Micrarchaeaceae archaeon]|nr:signal peptidase II [Candidatus Micrarchaeaceae archaeon]